MADLDGLQPFTDADERALVSDVIEQQNAVGASEVRLGYAAKPEQVNYTTPVLPSNTRV